MAKSGIDDGEIWVNPKRNAGGAAAPAAPNGAKAAAQSKVVGGAEELPGTPRPAKPGRSSIPDAADADHRRQLPGRVEQDAEVWDGQKWVRPSGEVVDPASPNGGGKGKGSADGPTVEADDDTEVISTPRRTTEEISSVPPFTGGGKATPSAKVGKEGQDFQEYKRLLGSDVAAHTFGLGGYVGAGAPSQQALRAASQPASPLFPAPLSAASHPSQPSMSAAPTPGPAAAQGSLGGYTESQGDTLVWTGGPSARGTPQPTAPAPRASVRDVHAPPLPQGAINVLLVGSGAREHAMALAIRRSQRAHLFVVTKHRNPGLVKSATGFKLLDDRDVAGIVAWAKMQKIHLAVTGPESALEAGLTDALRAAGVAVASPSQAAARIETSKTFMRELMARHDVPGRLAFHAFRDEASALRFLDENGPVWAIKPVGLTGGKGVQVHGDHFRDLAGAKAYVRSVFAGKLGGGSIQFEELARGEEYTVMAFTDGTTVLPMPAVQDHKRLLEGDKGPNTGGMGSYSCPDGLLPFLTKAEYDDSVRILKGLVDALRTDGTPYVGTIYGQFMLTTTGPKVIEVNARFGDPEAMNVLHLLESDYLSLLEAMATGTLSGQQARFRPAATVVKYVVPKGYGEGSPAPGRHVEVDLFNIRRAHGHAFMGSIEQLPMGTLATLTSRTIGVLGEGPTLEAANAVCEAGLRHVHGDGLFVRRDIGSAALVEQRVRHMAEIRQERVRAPEANPIG